MPVAKHRGPWMARAEQAGMPFLRLCERYMLPEPVHNSTPAQIPSTNPASLNPSLCSLRQRINSKRMSEWMALLRLCERCLFPAPAPWFNTSQPPHLTPTPVIKPDPPHSPASDAVADAETTSSTAPPPPAYRCRQSPPLVPHPSRPPATPTQTRPADSTY